VSDYAMGVGLVRVLLSPPTFICRSRQPGACGPDKCFPTSSTHSTENPTRMGEHRLRGEWPRGAEKALHDVEVHHQADPRRLHLWRQYRGCQRPKFSAGPVADDRLITTLGASPLLGLPDAAAWGLSRVTQDRLQREWR